MDADRTFFVYILASGVRGTLYTGITSDLLRRVWEHKNKPFPDLPHDMALTGSCGTRRMLPQRTAIRREKQIKEWKRDWKMNLIERDNPHWIDLFPGLGSN